MSSSNRRDGLPLMEGGGGSLNQTPDSPPPSYELAMTESYGRPYAPLPTSSTEHRDAPVAQTHPTSPPYPVCPTLDRPPPTNPYYNRPDPGNGTRPPIAAYPTNESVYIPSLPTSSSAFYNPMNQMPSPSAPGISQPTSEPTQSAANPQIAFKVPERNETTTAPPQFPDVNRGTGDCQHLKLCVMIIGLLVVVGVSIYIWRWTADRRRMKMKAREEWQKVNDDFFADSPFYSASRYSDGVFQSEDLLQYMEDRTRRYDTRSIVSRKKRRVERGDSQRRNVDDNDASARNWSPGKIQKNIPRILSIVT